VAGPNAKRRPTRRLTSIPSRMRSGET